MFQNNKSKKAEIETKIKSGSGSLNIIASGSEAIHYGMEKAESRNNRVKRDDSVEVS